MPPTNRRTAVRVEQLLAEPSRWSDEEAIAAGQHLGLEETAGRLGAEGFIDAVFNYVLQRRPDNKARMEYTARLADGSISPSALFRDVMRSEERVSHQTPLLSPFENGYPFVLA